ncbi:Macrolide export ATP-binding/permease protein macB [Fibrisoma limi BUZ 3]|uniref:Macrolide export ATP-binding/permease protein macB n=1 Tax=Fibrisoma limi BUZ 3 TaxID=1185876 RepID=I2GDG7_9BACT|nr:ABC transporter permease [Fibrisoma limi]CCH51941.1 Macrolide export ATP-binding/permease protein macB [Fibrisoma limi BUZ 3]
MLRNYLNIAVRNLRKDRTYSVINITGLAVGMAACLLIALYVQNELSYDRFWANGERIYRINQTNHFEEEREAATVSVPAGPTIARTVTGVEAMTRLFQRSGSMRIAQAGQSPKLFQEQHVVFADSSFFDVFPLPLRQGNPKLALTAPASVAISETVARTYFGNGNPIGRIIRHENKVDLTVTAVYADIPTTTDFKADFLIHFATLFAVETEGSADFLRKDWLYNTAQAFIRLAPGFPASRVEAQFPGVLRRSNDERVIKHVRLSLQPLHAIHLYSADLSGSSSTGNIRYVSLLSVIAGITLLIACFNFINLATAYSLRRAKEVGLRKTLGAVRSQLVGQFLGEAMLMSSLAFGLASVLAVVLLPYLNQFTGQSFVITDFLRPGLLSLWIGLFVLTGLLAGTYPAFFASKFRPVLALKGQTSERQQRGSRFRQVLVVAQFSVSLILIVAAVVIFQQLTYLRNKPLGFQKEQVVTIPLFGSGASGNLPQGIDGPLRMRMNTFEEAVVQSTRVKGITALSGLPGSGYVRSLVVPEGKTEQSNVFAAWVSVDYDFLQTLGIPLVAGRNFSKQTGTDHLAAFILNESAAKSFGYANAASAVGRPIQRGGEGGKKGLIIGVVKDFHFDPLEQPLEPLIIDIDVPRFTVFAVNVLPDRMPETIAHLRKQWESFFPERPFEYAFLDETLDNLYRTQEQQGQLLGLFAGLAIFISCLGLFGLVAYSTVQRTKEIGVRKVLGASVASIVTLLSTDFLKLVVIAILIASPVAWYFMNQWLQDFAYKIGIQWWVFALAGLLAIGIALLTVSFQSVKAALMNPVKSLRTD